MLPCREKPSGLWRTKETGRLNMVPKTMGQRKQTVSVAVPAVKQNIKDLGDFGHSFLTVLCPHYHGGVLAAAG